jgi:hypothetical protein
MPYTADYYFLAAGAHSGLPYASLIRGPEGPVATY